MTVFICISWHSWLNIWKHADIFTDFTNWDLCDIINSKQLNHFALYVVADSWTYCKLRAFERAPHCVVVARVLCNRERKRGVADSCRSLIIAAERKGAVEAPGSSFSRHAIDLGWFSQFLFLSLIGTFLKCITVWYRMLICQIPMRDAMDAVGRCRLTWPSPLRQAERYPGNGAQGAPHSRAHTHSHCFPTLIFLTYNFIQETAYFDFLADLILKIISC